MDVNLNTWYRCTIDKKEFKKLCKKSDLQGFKHMIIYLFAKTIILGGLESTMGIFNRSVYHEDDLFVI